MLVQYVPSSFMQQATDELKILEQIFTRETAVATGSTSASASPAKVCCASADHISRASHEPLMSYE